MGRFDQHKAEAKCLIQTAFALSLERFGRRGRSKKMGKSRTSATTEGTDFTCDKKGSGLRVGGEASAKATTLWIPRKKKACNAWNGPSAGKSEGAATKSTKKNFFKRGGGPENSVSGGSLPQEGTQKALGLGRGTPGLGFFYGNDSDARSRAKKKKKNRERRPDELLKGRGPPLTAYHLKQGDRDNGRGT